MWPIWIRSTMDEACQLVLFASTGFELGLIFQDPLDKPCKCGYGLEREHGPQGNNTKPHRTKSQRTRTRRKLERGKSGSSTWRPTRRSAATTPRPGRGCRPWRIPFERECVCVSAPSSICAYPTMYTHRSMVADLSNDVVLVSLRREVARILAARVRFCTGSVFCCARVELASKGVQDGPP